MISVSLGGVNLHVGDIIRVHSQLIEGQRVRTQIFEGILMRLRGRGENITFTVRKIGSGSIGVERIWPLDSKDIIKIEVKKKAAKVRRAKLYYLRDRVGKAAKKA